jgi:glycerol-3-phosphate dehydrogenase
VNDVSLRRDTQLRAAADRPADVLIVGGGINGVGALLDAAARGLDAVLVERDDIGVGTSSRSSKLVHGGLRYLEQLEFGLVREALTERDRLHRLAPHLVDLERFLVPLFRSRFEIPYVYAGLTLYDLLGGRRGGRCRQVRRAELAELAPVLRTDEARGAFEYTDGVTDDARLVTTIARSAAQLGGRVLTRVEVEGLLTRGDRVAGVAALDRPTGRRVELRATTVIDATGAFAASSPWSLGHAGLQPSRGSHVVLPRHRIDLHRGLTLRVPGRVVFLIPWFSTWLLGTTDVPHDGDLDRPTATDDEVDYLLGTANRSLDVDLAPSDVIASFAGIRPLIGARSETSRISRRHQVRRARPGLITVRGGKLTTYRRIAAAAVDAAAVDLGAVPPSGTATLPLHGAAPAPSLRLTRRTLEADGVPADVAASLVRRHGIDAPIVLTHARRTGGTDRLLPDLPYLVGEVAHAAEHEWASTVEDVLARRTRAVLQDADQARAAAVTVAEVLGDAYDWNASTRRRHAEMYEEASWQYAPLRTRAALPPARSA